MTAPLPPLPPSPAEVGDLILQIREHVQALGWGNREQIYTASQVRTYGAACAAAERELCARVCEAEEILGLNDERAYNGRLMAAAIRAMKDRT